MSKDPWEVHPGIEILIQLTKNKDESGYLELARLEELSLEAIKNRSRNNLGCLFQSLKKDALQLDIKLEVFEQASQSERDAFNKLASETVVRASHAKSTDCVRRISRILARSVQSGLKLDYETEREFIDVALQLGNRDAALLTLMLEGSEMVNAEPENSHLEVSYARLQAQGLIRPSNDQTAGLRPYSLTRFGSQFGECGPR